MRKISTYVIAVHCAIILWMAWLGFHEKPHKKARLVVKSVSPKQTVAQVRPSPAPVAAAPSPPQTKPIAPPAAPVVAAAPPAPAPVVAAAPKQAAAPKKSSNLQATTPQKKKPAAAPAPAPKPQPRAPAISNELLKQIEQSLAKLEQAPAQPSAPKVSSKKSALSVPVLTIDHADGSDGDESYESDLITSLHNQLNLPEYGEVKMKLTLQNNGTCVKIQVVRAQSVKNRRYLEEQLPKLRLPPFAGALAAKKELTFVMTFCNE